MWSAEIKINTSTLYKIILSPPGSLCLGVVITLLLKGWSSESAAAWVQAIGGIAAVGAAFYIGNKQARDTARARRQRDEVIFRLVCGIAKRAAEVSHVLFVNFDSLHESDTAKRVEVLTEAEEHLMAMKVVSPVDLPLPEMVEPFMAIRGALEKATVMARLLSEPQVDRMRCATVLAHSSQKIKIAADALMSMELVSD
ncbi:hypothetical protein GCM10009103_07670 [Pseudomonas koreensis]|nr:hypothetical protein GCM10009103_07670 [Pseudomonas koreensis]